MNARPPRTPRTIAIAVFALAFVVRLVWILRVQSPLDAVYSDMGGYVDRAEGLLAHRTLADPRVLAIYPFGTHYLLALEFLALGRNANGAIAIAHALIGALPAPCMVALTVRLVPSRVAATVVGVLVALWYPQVAFAGFFLSEMWFSAAIALHAWVSVHTWKRPLGLLAVGVFSTLAFVVRPQFVMTWAIQTSARALSLLRRRGVSPTARALFWLCLPLAIGVGVSSVRLHRLSGHWGLISENDQMTRVWAETDICRLEATWRTPTGEQWTYWFNPPSKPAHKPSDTVRFKGYIADPDILRSIRLERTRGVPWTARIARAIGNVELLFVRNLPWPESNYKDPPWRGQLQEGFASGLLFGVVPLCAAGLALGPWNRTMLVVAANLLTPLVAAALYFGEGRYHVPYDPFALLMGVVGVHELGRRLRRFIHRLRRRAAREPAPQRLAALG